MNIHEQLLYKEFASIISGKKSTMTFRGTANEVKAVKNILLTSKSLRETIEKEDVLMTEIATKIEQKNSAAKEFEKITGLI